MSFEEEKPCLLTKQFHLRGKGVASLSPWWRILYPDSPAWGHPVMPVLNVRSDFSVTFSTECITLPIYVLAHRYACIHIKKYTYTHMHKNTYTHTHQCSSVKKSACVSGKWRGHQGNLTAWPIILIFHVLTISSSAQSKELNINSIRKYKEEIPDITGESNYS